MPVSSQTVGGVNVWAFQGAVTDAEIKTAWAGLIVDGEYVINRSIYLAQFVDLTGVQGGYSVRLTIGVNNFLLHTLRDRSKSAFKQWHFRQTVGMTVPQRTQMVANWNGTALSYPLTSGGVYDGLSMEGGVFEYAVVGNTGLGGDSRFLNEMAFLTLDGTQILSTAFTEQEMQPQVRGFTELKGLTFTRNFGFPQTSFETSRIVVFRSNLNTQHPTQRPIRINNSASICYIDSEVRRNALPVTTNLIDGFGSQTARLLVLNNHTDESWFGETRLDFNGKVVNWGANNQFFGGILKRFRFVGAGANGTVKVYDSRSTTEPQRSNFVSFNAKDFLDTEITTQTDTNGRVEIVSMGAQMLPNLTITRFTEQKFTFQEFGFRVLVNELDVTAGGDNDLSAFSPVVLTEQAGIGRTLTQINAATEINNFQELLEELHVIAVNLSGQPSFDGAFNGNLFNYDGTTLTTSFANVVIDATATNKIDFDHVNGILTIKSTKLMDSLDVQRWNNTDGNVILQNGATIEGVYQDANGTATVLTITGFDAGTSVYVEDHEGNQVFFSDNQTDDVIVFIPPTATSPWYYAVEKYGNQRQSDFFQFAGGNITIEVKALEDIGITDTLANVENYTSLETLDKIYDFIAFKRLTPPVINYGQIAFRDGNILFLEDVNLVINQNNANVLDFDQTNKIITIKGLVLNEGVTFKTIKATPPATIEPDTNEIINVLIEDANGDSQIVILGGDNQGYQLWKVATNVVTDDFETGNLLATLQNNTLPFRFIGLAGFDIVGRDTSSGVRRRTSMAKGGYTQAFYVGNEIQLATDAPQLTENNQKLDELILKVDTLENTDLTEVAKTEDLVIINNGVKKSSLLIPHQTNLTNG